MRYRLIVAAAAALAMVVPSRAARGQQAARPEPAPDISGVWLVEKFQPVLFPKGGAPFKPWAGAKFRATNPQTNDPNLACLPEGLPRFMISVPYPMEIFQVPTRVIILHEGMQPVRQIYLNRQHLKDLDPSFAGDSIGKWEGDTLVVDTIGFNEISWIDGALPHSEAMHLIERIRRIDHDTLVDDITIEDPVAYTRALTAHEVYKLKPGWEIREYVCAQNNKYSYQPK